MDYGTEKLLEAFDAATAAFQALGYQDLPEKMLEARRLYDKYHAAPSDANGHRCPECGTHLQYQGWPNKETWDAYMVLGNDERNYRTCCRVVLAAGNLDDAADALKDHWDEVTYHETEDTHPLVSGLFSTAWSSIDWHAVAEAFAPESAKKNDHGLLVWGDEEDEEDE
ncbi:MAG TPA: hypothetical protein VH593_11350 [Ktedonobacteraceae bacterium]|jgi:hypothetical protein